LEPPPRSFAKLGAEQPIPTRVKAGELDRDIDASFAGETFEPGLDVRAPAISHEMRWVSWAGGEACRDAATFDETVEASLDAFWHRSRNRPSLDDIARRESDRPRLWFGSSMSFAARISARSVDTGILAGCWATQPSVSRSAVEGDR
jgi:hypothetical protein